MSYLNIVEMVKILELTDSYNCYFGPLWKINKEEENDGSGPTCFLGRFCKELGLNYVGDKIMITSSWKINNDPGISDKEILSAWRKVIGCHELLDPKRFRVMYADLKYTGKALKGRVLEHYITALTETIEFALLT